MDGTGEFNSDDHYIYNYGQDSKNPLEECELSSESMKDSKMQYLVAISKTTEWITFVSKAKQSTSQ